MTVMDPDWTVAMMWVIGAAAGWCFRGFAERYWRGERL